MIEKKLIHFSDYNKYIQYKKTGDLLDTSIIFIKNDESIETHNTLYKMVKWGKIIPSVSSYSDWEIINLEIYPTDIEPCESVITIAGLALRTIYWDDGNISTETTVPNFSASYGTLTNNLLTIPANTNLENRYITITAKLDNVTKSIQVTQKGDYIETYGDISLTIVNSLPDIPASGGTVSTSKSVATQNVIYKSGSNGTINVPVTEQSISAASKTFYASDRTKVGTITVTVENGGKSASKSIDVYLLANVKTLSHIDAYANYSSNMPDNIKQADWLAAGGGYIECVCYGYYNFTSGVTNHAENVTSNTTWTSLGNYGKIEGNLFIVDSRGTSTGIDRYNYIYASYQGKTDSFNTGNQKNEKWSTGTTGGGYSYGGVSAGSITNATIPAGGGSATAYAGNGSQYWYRAAITTYYSYTSGSSSNAVTLAAADGYLSVSPSLSSYTASADSKGTDISNVTTIGSRAVTWNGSGGYSASNTMYVYLEANNITYYTTLDSNNNLTFSGTYYISSINKTGTPVKGTTHFYYGTGKYCTLSFNDIKINCIAYYTSGSHGDASIYPSSFTYESAGAGVNVQVNDPSTGNYKVYFSNITDTVSISFTTLLFRQYSNHSLTYQLNKSVSYALR